MIAVSGVASLSVNAEEPEDRRAALGRTKAEFLWAQSEPGGVSGEVLYQVNCLRCHKITGEGFQPLIPPLAKSDYFADNPNRLLSVVMEGVSGPITVNGKWGNPGGTVTAEQVAAYRKAAGLPDPLPREPFRD